MTTNKTTSGSQKKQLKQFNKKHGIVCRYQSTSTTSQSSSRRSSRQWRATSMRCCWRENWTSRWSRGHSWEGLHRRSGRRGPSITRPSSSLNGQAQEANFPKCHHLQMMFVGHKGSANVCKGLLTNLNPKRIIDSSPETKTTETEKSKRKRESICLQAAVCVCVLVYVCACSFQLLHAHPPQHPSSMIFSFLFSCTWLCESVSCPYLAIQFNYPSIKLVYAAVVSFLHTCCCWSRNICLAKTHQAHQSDQSY